VYVLKVTQDNPCFIHFSVQDLQQNLLRYYLLFLCRNSDT